MTERGILFSAPMVRAILAGRKTKTRRIVKPQLVEPAAKPLRHAAKRPGPYFDSYCSERKTPENPRGMSNRWCWWTADDRPDPLSEIRCPYGQPGDRLWARETWRYFGGREYEYQCDRGQVIYRADPDAADGTWRPAIFMFRWASRITLDVAKVRVERLQDITEEDAIAEGVVAREIPADDYGPRRIGYVLGDDDGKCALWPTARAAFANGWDRINIKRAPWASNPYVWAIDLRPRNKTP